MLAALFVSAAQAQVGDKLAACAACHGADGNSAVAGTPSIAAQPQIFLENYLVMTREGIRGSHAMQKLLKGVPDKEIVAFAAHYAAQKPSRAEGKPDPALFKQGKALARRTAARAATGRISAAASRCRASPASARNSSPR